MTPRVHVVPLPALGPEDVVVATDGPDEGAVFTGTEDGSVWRVSHDGRRIDCVARTGGRPLGIELGLDGRLVVCDATRGLLAVDPRTGGVEVLATEADGRPILVCNNAAVAADGTIWFSDSSAVFPLEQWRDDLLARTRSGRLLRRTPDGDVEVVLTGLEFANGVALLPGDREVVVAESTARTLVRHRVADGPGERDLLVADLGAHPDNIARGSDGLLWVTMTGPADPVVQGLMRAPRWAQRLATRVPERLQPLPRPGVHVRAYDADGRVVHDVVAETDDMSMITGVREHAGRLWLGSLRERAIAYLDR